MTALLLLFFDICRLKRNPQDIPSSALLKNFSILTYLLLGFLVQWIAQGEPKLPAVMSTLDTVLFLAMGYAALWTRGYEQRATQTITALFGSGAFLYLLSLMFVLLPDSPASMLLLLVHIWSIVVIGHILSQSLNLALGWGIAISFLYYILQFNLFGVAFLPNQ